MNLVHGEIVEVLLEDGMRIGRIRVGGAVKKIPLDLLTGAECGDTVLLAYGVAISKVRPVDAAETNDVPSDPR